MYKFLDYQINNDPNHPIEEMRSMYVYPNQREVAKEIMKSFHKEETNWCVVTAQMQSGKTGVIQQLEHYVLNRDIMSELGIIDTGNVYIILGIALIELKSQTQERMLSNNNVFIHTDLQRIIKNKRSKYTRLIRKMKKRSLFILDESHVGISNYSVIKKFFKLLGITGDGNVSKWRTDSIYVVSISATPMAELVNNQETRYKQVLYLKPGKGYIGIKRLFEAGNVYKSFPIRGNVNKLISIINKHDKTKYMVIRLSDSRVKRQICERTGAIPIEYDGQHPDIEIDEYLGKDCKPPKRFTIIFIKQKIRAGITLNTHLVSLMFDSFTLASDTTVQSLLGRMCGYNQSLSCDVYCNRKQAQYFIEYIDNNCRIVPGSQGRFKYVTPNRKYGRIECIPGIPILGTVRKGSKLQKSILKNAESLKKYFNNSEGIFDGPIEGLILKQDDEDKLWELADTEDYHVESVCKITEDVSDKYYEYFYESPASSYHKHQVYICGIPGHTKERLLEQGFMLITVNLINPNRITVVFMHSRFRINRNRAMTLGQRSKGKKGSMYYSY